MHDNTTGRGPTLPGTTIDLRAQVLETLCPTAAFAKLADCVFGEPLPVLLCSKDKDLARRLVPGQWVHAVGGARFPLPEVVCALEMTSCEPLRDEDWGGADLVGAEEMVSYHSISTRARVMSAWRFYDEPDWNGGRQYGYTADLALADGRDGTRAVLHWWLATSSCRERHQPPPLAAGDLVAVNTHLSWYPRQLSKPLPPRTPILDLYNASNIEVVRR